MRSQHKGFTWRTGFAVFCLAYTAWMVYLGLGNLDKVHREYRWAVQELQPDRIDKIVRQDLAAECRKVTPRQPRRGDRYLSAGAMPQTAAADPCRSFPPAVIEERRTAVTERLQEEKSRLQRRLVAFSISFTMFFVLLPLAALYLLLTFLAWLFRDMKFIR